MKKIVQHHLYHQPQWKGRKLVRHFVCALAIGTISLTLGYVYKKIDYGWTRDTTIIYKDAKGPREQFISATTVFLLNGTTTWTVPANFNALVSVECIAAGSAGNSNALASTRKGGAGAAYAKITSTSTTLTPGVTSINVGIGTGPGVLNASSLAGGDTWWNATSLANAVTNGSAISCAAQGGGPTSATPAVGGAAASSVGTTKFSGGNGSAVGTANGGGGAGGPAGAGGAGTNTAGGAANNATTAGPTVTANGNSGTEFDPTHGCGTGAFTSTSTAQSGGLYGGGGTGTGSAVTSGAGGNGLLVIVFTIKASPPPFSRPMRFYKRRF